MLSDRDGISQEDGLPAVAKIWLLTTALGGAREVERAEQVVVLATDLCDHEQDVLSMGRRIIHGNVHAMDGRYYIMRKVTAHR